jgi:hypothetical protein
MFEDVAVELPVTEIATDTKAHAPIFLKIDITSFKFAQCGPLQGGRLPNCRAKIYVVREFLNVGNGSGAVIAARRGNDRFVRVAANQPRSSEWQLRVKTRHLSDLIG